MPASKLLVALALLLTACGEPARSPAGPTCERRDACGNLAGLTVAECARIEEAYLATLGGERPRCERAWEACLSGAICDDFRECHADIGRDVCGCPDVRVAIVDPADGQTITSADDVDPSSSQLEYDFVIEASCLEDELEQVELRLLAPVESSYGFGTPDARGRATLRVPLIPGTNRFRARGARTSVESAEIAITVSP